MRYMFFNDLQTMKKAIKIIIMYWCILVFSYLILYNFELNSTNAEKYILLLGLDLNFNNIISISFNILNILIYVIITVKLFTKDITLGNTNLFLRMSLVKWISLKTFIILFVITLIKIITHILIGLLCNVVPMYLLTDILFTMLFSTFFIAVLITIKNNVLIIVLILIFFHLCYSYRLSIKTVSIDYYIISCIILQISLILIFHKEILKLFKEGTDENRS